MENYSVPDTFLKTYPCDFTYVLQQPCQAGRLSPFNIRGNEVLKEPMTFFFKEGGHGWYEAV